MEYTIWIVVFGLHIIRCTSSVKLTVPRNVTVNEGVSVKLDCPFKDVHDYVLLWKRGAVTLFKNDLKVDSEPRYSKDGTSLVIQEAQIRDDGTYICEIAANPVQMVTFYVEVVPGVIKRPYQNPVYISEGQSMDLHCKDASNSTFNWYLVNSLAKEMLIGSGYTFSIFNASVEQEGTYRCKSLVQPSYSALFDVKILIKPTVYVDSERIETDEGRELILNCTSTSKDDTVSLSWMSQAKEFSFQSSPRIYANYFNNSKNSLQLIFDAIQVIDSTNYTCLATNAAGNSTKSVEVIVRSKNKPTPDGLIDTNTIVIIAFASASLSTVVLILFYYIYTRVKKSRRSKRTLRHRRALQSVSNSNADGGLAETVYDQLDYSEIKFPRSYLELRPT